MTGAYFSVARRSALAGLALILASWLAACGGQPALPALLAGDIRQQQTVDNLTITLDAAQAPAVNQPQRLLVTLTNRSGAPVEGAEVYLDLDMDMLCLSGHKPIAEPQGAGSYLVETVYPMAGEWIIKVIAEVDGTERQAVFATDVLE